MMCTSSVVRPLGPLMADVSGLALTGEERRFLRHPAIGAVILFRRNYTSPQQVVDLIREIKSLRSPPLLVAVDQEGGRVQRFREDFHPLPSLHTLGRLYEVDPHRARQLAWAAGRLMAAELRRVDVDFSFAPVLDIPRPGSGTDVIGNRAIHYEAQVVIELATDYIRGMSSSGMSATGKHFPGHGGVCEDSHRETPVDPRSIEELWQKDLRPYQSLCPWLGGVMTAHVQFPSVDERLPTYSGYWIRDVLRRQIGFQGVVFSDDLSMQGAATVPSPAHRARLALAAGCDMVLVCNHPPGAREVAKQLGKGPYSRHRALENMAGTGSRIDDEALSRLADALQPLFELAERSTAGT